MMNYLLSQGQWKVVTNKFPAPDYETITRPTGQSEGGGSKTETVEDTSKPPKNQSDINTLGTRTKIPTSHMLDTLGVQTTSDSNVPSGQKLGLLKMYP